jgi:hypothetical protein
MHADPEGREVDDQGSLANSATVVLFFFDVLGFSERVEELGLPRILAQYESLLATIRSRAGGRVVLEAEPVDNQGTMVPVAAYLDLRSTYFSDTVLIWTGYDPIRFRVSADLVLDFFCDCLHNGLPLRGGIAFGEALMDEGRGIFLGSPIVEAARAEAAQRWCGCSFGPSLDAFPALGPVDRFIPYKAHMKAGKEHMLRALALDWPRRWRKLFPEQDLSTVIDSYRRPDHEAYWDVTQEFVDYSLAHPEWWTEQ